MPFVRFGSCLVHQSLMSSDETEFMRDEYDFTNGVRGKHHEAYKNRKITTPSDSDVGEVIKNSVSDKQALRTPKRKIRDPEEDSESE